MTVALLLINPKYPHNVGAAVRAASCLGAGVVLFTGDRVSLTGGRGSARLPREERMKDYQNVEIKHVDQHEVFKRMRGTPVAVELVPNAQPLPAFEHPEDAVYVFGPEDGSLSRAVLGLCHEFVRIPSNHCLNLGAAVNLTLYDRMIKVVDPSDWYEFMADSWDGADEDGMINAAIGIQ